MDANDHPIAITGMGFQSGTVGYAMPGDANLDGKVDINDLTIVLAHYNQTRHDLDRRASSPAAARWTSTT